MKKVLLTCILYLCIIVACLGVLYVVHRVTDLGPDQIIEEDTLPAIDESLTAETETATQSEAASELDDQHSIDSQGGLVTEGRKRRPSHQWQPPTEAETEAEEEEVYVPPTVVFATDMHVLAPELMGDGEAFDVKIAKDDGKVMPYHHEIIDAFISEVIQINPTALILSGDLTFNGEKVSHRYFAEKLTTVQDAGIQVLAMPGNHDINNPAASSYAGEEAQPVEYITGAEFAEIYAAYGYQQASSRDEYSLSYTYQLDETHWMMLIDTNIYQTRNHVSGKIQVETFEWMKEQFEAAAEVGATIIPVGHHNLLEQSRLYIDECVMENNDAAIWLLEEWQVPVYFSGHLHAQRIKKHFTEPGMPKDIYSIFEIVNSPLTMPPCQYGVLKWQNDDSMQYQMRNVNVEAWARAQGLENEELLNFNQYQEEFFSTVIGAQIRENIKNLSVEHTDEMVNCYVEILRQYVEGNYIDPRAVKYSKGYQYWERNLPKDEAFIKIQDMIKDSGQNNKAWRTEAPLKESLE